MISRVIGAIRRRGVIGACGRVVGMVFDPGYTWVYSRVGGIRVGKGTRIKFGAKLRREGGRIQIGNNCVIHGQSCILAYGGDIVIGNGVTVNPFSILYGHGGLRIGDGVLIAAGCVVVAANHQHSLGIPIRGQGLTCKGISIADDVWLAAGARVLDGSLIERGAIIAAGCVVAGQHVKANVIFGGVPGRVIGERKKLEATITT